MRWSDQLLHGPCDCPRSERPDRPGAVEQVDRVELGLIIHSIYNGYWYWGRPTPEELRQTFREISKKYRWDWDLSDAEVREVWRRGERSRFWPYGETPLS